MKTSHLILAALLAPIPASVLVSCAQINSAMNTVGLGIGAKQTLETDVDDLRSMRSELEASWAAIQSRTASLEQDVANFGPGDHLGSSGVDLAVLSDDILNAAEVEAREAGAVDVETVDIEAAYRETDAATRAEIQEVQAEGRRIMTELKSGIPTSVATLGTEAGKTVARAAAIQLKAEKMESVAAKNPLMTEENMKTMRSNQALIQKEVDQLSVLAERIASESNGITGRMSQALATFQGKVATLKTVR